mgnify:CR=1 FL=1
MCAYILSTSYDVYREVPYLRIYWLQLTHLGVFRCAVASSVKSRKAALFWWGESQRGDLAALHCTVKTEWRQGQRMRHGNSARDASFRVTGWLRRTKSQNNSASCPPWQPAAAQAGPVEGKGSTSTYAHTTAAWRQSREGCRTCVSDQSYMLLSRLRAHLRCSFSCPVLFVCMK